MKKLCYSFLCILLFQISFSQSWNQKSDFPAMARFASIGFENNGFGYICGGSSGNTGTSTHYNELWQYNPVNDSWISRSSFPGTVRRGMISFTIDSLSYVGLGYNYNLNQLFNDVYSYNPNTNSWSPIATFPGGATRNISSVALMGKGYVVGGGYQRGTSTLSNQLWEYDPVSNTWTQKSNFPLGGRMAGTVFASDSLLYYGLGHNGSTTYSDFWAYNPQNDVWTAVDSFPSLSRFGASVIVINGKAIVGGGSELISGAINYPDYYAYDMTSDNWVAVPLFVNSKRWYSATFTIGNKGYIALGGDSTRNIMLNDVWEYIDTTLVTNLTKAARLESDLSIYPNPTQGVLKIKNTSNQLINISIRNISGQELRTLILSGGSNQVIDISELAKGIYFYHVKHEKGEYMGKIVLN